MSPASSCQIFFGQAGETDPVEFDDADIQGFEHSSDDSVFPGVDFNMQIVF